MFQDASLRRFITWPAVVAYAIVVTGLPLPVGASPTATSSDGKRLSAKDRSAPFPCMDKPCGCATAEQCFTNCCCHTPAETLAWARARKVEPSVITALQRRVAADLARSEPSCCGTKKSCCEAAAAGSTEPRSSEKKRAGDSFDERAPDKGVSLRAMLACGGIVSQWCAAGIAVPTSAVILETTLPSLESMVLSDEADASAFDAPESPPPRDC